MWEMVWCVGERRESPEAGHWGELKRMEGMVAEEGLGADREILELL